MDETKNEVDNEVVTPGTAATRHGMQVAKQDQQEFLLMGGKWVGKGAIRKVAEI